MLPPKAIVNDEYKILNAGGQIGFGNAYIVTAAVEYADGSMFAEYWSWNQYGMIPHKNYWNMGVSGKAETREMIDFQWVKEDIERIAKESYFNLNTIMYRETRFDAALTFKYDFKEINIAGLRHTLIGDPAKYEIIGEFANTSSIKLKKEIEMTKKIFDCFSFGPTS